MSDTLWWIIAAVVLVALVAAVVLAMRNRTKHRLAEQKVQADRLRQQAATRTESLTAAEREAQEAEARAQLARAEAEKAELARQQAQQGLTVEQARHEDVLREADRLDPDVDHTSEEYRPGAAAPVDPAGPEGPPAGQHRRDA